jgi:hypothetical protein
MVSLNYGCSNVCLSGPGPPIEGNMYFYIQESTIVVTAIQNVYFQIQESVIVATTAFTYTHTVCRIDKYAHTHFIGQYPFLVGRWTPKITDPARM